MFQRLFRRLSQRISETKNTVIINYKKDYLAEAAFSRSGRVLLCVPTKTQADQAIADLYKIRIDKNFMIQSVFDGQERNKAPIGNDRVLVTTPGRLKMAESWYQPDRVVFKEADLLLTVPSIVDSLRNFPKNTQRVLLSATLDPWFNDLLADETIGAPFEIIGQPLGAQTKVELPWVRHAAAVVETKERVEAASFACQQVKGLVYLSKTELLSLETQRLQGWMFLHQGLTPNVRRSVLKLFSQRQVGVLALTDAIARGLDLPDIKKVFHFGMIASRDTYIQRLLPVRKAGQCDSVIFVNKKRDMFEAQKNLGVKFETADGLVTGKDLERRKVVTVIDQLKNDKTDLDPVLVAKAKEIFNQTENKTELIACALTLFMAAAKTTSVLSGLANYQAILLVDQKMRSIKTRTEAKRAILNCLNSDVKLGRIALSKYGFIVDVPADHVGRVLEARKLRPVVLSSLPELVENETLQKHLWAQREKRSVAHRIKQSVRWR